MPKENVPQVVAEGHRLIEDILKYAATLMFVGDDGRFLAESTRLKLKLGAVTTEIADRLYDLEVSYEKAREQGEI